LGANTGEFSRIAAKKANLVVSSDIDPAAVELNYRQVKTGGENKIIPLVLDLTNPSGGLGWANQERMSLAERGPAETVMALALIHHLAISNNLPFSMIAEFFARICQSLIIEFVPKEDSQVQRLLATREDIFPNYTQVDFEKEFGRWFTVTGKEPVKGSKRTVYLLKRKS
jgi:ribosomal protein L11 methylase PrmA